MKEKNELESFDVNDYVNGLSGFSRGSKQHVKNDELATEPTSQSVRTETIEPTPPNVQTAPTELAEPTRRTSSKQRKASLDEYRELFLKVPKITDRQPVFVSRSTRDRIDDIVRRLGERRMSVSGFLGISNEARAETSSLDYALQGEIRRSQNLANHHLETYNEEVEQWKRL